jgi:hypothetical protein
MSIVCTTTVINCAWLRCWDTNRAISTGVRLTHMSWCTRNTNAFIFFSSYTAWGTGFVKQQFFTIIAYTLLSVGVFIDSTSCAFETRLIIKNIISHESTEWILRDTIEAIIIESVTNITEAIATKAGAESTTNSRVARNNRTTRKLAILNLTKMVSIITNTLSFGAVAM